MSELGLDVITGPVKRLVCRIWGHRLVPGSHWQGSMACGRCGLGVRVSCSCRFDRPSARDLTGHRYDCPLHPPEGWPFGQPVDRVEVVEVEDEHGLKFVPFKAEQPEPERQLIIDPNDQLWQLDDDGQVKRRVSTEELDSWAAYTEPSDVRSADREVVLHLPVRYRGIPYRITRVGWAEFVMKGGPPPGPPNPPRPPKDRPYA